ncbi:MAG: Signal transduction histidine-protein kinase BaeS [Paracidovorax wautersii]|uniref:histidine kinase n=1 Tax=Paracidovorax wautersii TaxID=1177982 RepID=A0A7V8JPW0_9BURK|nr:MAG: Signal transduction histidine-protein kinase BaeS [Paracidovorax wautersii]
MSVSVASPRGPLARLSISTRLFLAVLATAILMVVAMGAVASWSFKRGFVGYLNEQAMQRLEDILPRAATAYAEHGSWQFLREEPERWFEITRPGRNSGRASRFVRGEADPPVSDLTGAFLRLTLLDADHQYILGLRLKTPSSKHHIERPIVVDGLTVGWLSLEPFQSVTEVGARRFQDRQLQASWLIGLGAIALAAAIAWWVARALLRPIRRVAQATHALAGGDYTRRVPVATDDEVGQLARDFNHLAGTLERNEQLRRNFMADVSHELRTPLGVLNGELEAIEDGIRPLDTRTMQSLQAEVATLNKLVDDLHDLALADVAALAYRKADLDLTLLTRQAGLAYADRFAQAGLSLDLDLPAQSVTVYGDERRLHQLLLNLLENSRRYTDAPGQVRLRLRPPAPGQQPALATLELMDSAPDVPDAQRPRLFERFYRVDASRSRASGGSGLGLSICQRIVQAHDGSITASASPLGGLCITVTLPVA